MKQNRRKWRERRVRRARSLTGISSQSGQKDLFASFHIIISSVRSSNNTANKRCDVEYRIHPSHRPHKDTHATIIHHYTFIDTCTMRWLSSSRSTVILSITFGLTCWVSVINVVVVGITPNTHPNRREAAARAIASVTAPFASALVTLPASTVASTVATASPPSSLQLQVVQDPQTYTALAYSPPRHSAQSPPPPLIVVLHGAGRNDLEIRQDLADPNGEHAGLIPSLIAASGQAPKLLLENFAVLAPYSQGRPSFYQDSRSQLLNFIEWAKVSSNSILFDPNRIFLFGFSDGATVAVELMTTRRFAGAIICSYGYTGGALPARAVERLAGLPMWVFHSADDVIFDVSNSDRLVQQLKNSVAATTTTTTTSSDIIRYNRYDQDPEHLPSRVRGHSMGITASKSPEVYEWMLQQPPLAT
jgi:predicted esterase